MKQYLITPAAGKRLIGKALAIHPAVRAALGTGTLVIVAGTTNGYAAEEILASIGQAEGFDRRRFFRGIVLPPSPKGGGAVRSGHKEGFPGDVVIAGGTWQKGKTIYDAVDDLKAGDLILKGANALSLPLGRAAILVGHPKAGTAGVAIQAVIGRRVRLLIPVGCEKCVDGDLDVIAEMVNDPESQGPRYLPLPGQVFTELDAIDLLTGAKAMLIASGGVGGAEGAVWLAVGGTEEQMQAADRVLKSIGAEPPFQP